MNESPIRRHLAADPFPWALWLLLRRFASKLKSACLGWLFVAPGLYLGPGCHVMGSRFIRFGRNLYAHSHLWLEALPSYKNQQFKPSIDFGDHVSLSERVHISCIDRVHIGHRVLIGSGVYIGDHQHGSYSGPEQSHPHTAPASRLLGGGGPVFVGDDVWIGENAVIIGPVSIGRGVIVGANSVVRRDVPEYTIVSGAPARPIKRFNEMTHQWETVEVISENPEGSPDPAGLLTRHVAQRR